MTAHKASVLFICTGNSCRSQMAEAILRQIGGHRFETYSAGSHPAGFVHPLALEALAHLDVPAGDPISKSWSEYAVTQVDVVITVCDQAAGEPCPIWPGNPLRAHWPLPDPVYHRGAEHERLAFAITVAERIKSKVRALVDLDWSMAREELQREIRRLGEI